MFYYIYRCDPFYAISKGITYCIYSQGNDVPISQTTVGAAAIDRGFPPAITLGNVALWELTDVKAAPEEIVAVDIVTKVVPEVMTEVKKHIEDVTEAMTEVVTDVKGATKTHVLVVKGLVAEEKKTPAVVVLEKIQAQENNKTVQNLVKFSKGGPLKTIQETLEISKLRHSSLLHRSPEQRKPPPDDGRQQETGRFYRRFHSHNDRNQSIRIHPRGSLTFTTLAVAGKAKAISNPNGTVPGLRTFDLRWVWIRCFKRSLTRGCAWVRFWVCISPTQCLNPTNSHKIRNNKYHTRQNHVRYKWNLSEPNHQSDLQGDYYNKYSNVSYEVSVKSKDGDRCFDRINMSGEDLYSLFEVPYCGPDYIKSNHVIIGFGYSFFRELCDDEFSFRFYVKKMNESNIEHIKVVKCGVHLMFGKHDETSGDEPQPKRLKHIE
ncbi:hypothetical protein LWI28_021229 [Acer negundo]|uniref:Uncharacterized protein n=1 Tax=Acer negundo TaxID=4023 RepID=A0AAD5NJF8_ACENE|nr:hypothetical protein LWI28_021229 [Acer negundo]